MTKEDILIPTIFLGAILMTSVMPIYQMTLMHLNGGLTYIFAIPFDTDKSNTTEITSIVFNSIATIIGLFLFYKSKKTLTRVLTSFLILFTGQAVMLFVVDKLLTEDDSYYIYWTVLSGTPVLATLLVGLYKYQTLKHKFRTQT
jgi:TctA family transporter